MRDSAGSQRADHGIPSGAVEDGEVGDGGLVGVDGVVGGVLGECECEGDGEEGDEQVGHDGGWHRDGLVEMARRCG